MNDTSSGNLSADSPIKELAADSLGYRPFAQNIATILDNATTREDCLVLGIHGEWGSGKTSAINLVIKELEDRQKGTEIQTKIIHFSPWLFSGQENLTFAFFHELDLNLNGEEWTKLKDSLKEMASATLPIAGSIMNLFYPGTKDIAKAIKETIDRKPSLEKTKNKLQDILKQQQRPLLIIIDDIDRLPADEMRQIFRMVKSVADLPYVTYLLGFDRKIVKRALEKDTDLEGPEWSEKIIQGSFDLPHIIPFRIELYFWNKLKTDIPDLYSQLDHDTAPYFKEYLFPQLKNPRQVTRLINALIVGWLSVKDSVNPTLFVIIESWRLFNHGLYEFIKDNRDYICYDTQNGNNLEIFEKEMIIYNQKLNIDLHYFFARGEATPALKLYYPIISSRFFYNYFIYDNNSQLLSPAELTEVENSLDHIEQAPEIINKFSNDILDHHLSKNRALLLHWKQNLSAYSERKITKIACWVVSIYDYSISIEKQSVEYNIQDEIKYLIINVFEHIRNDKLQTELLKKLYHDFPFCSLLMNKFCNILFTNDPRIILRSNELNNLINRYQDILKETYQTKITELVSTKKDFPSFPEFIIIFFNIFDAEWIDNFLHNNIDQAINIMLFILQTSSAILDQYNRPTQISCLLTIAKEVQVSDCNESSKQIAKDFCSMFDNQ